MRCFEHNIGLIIAKKMQENCATNYGLDCTVCARFQNDNAMSSHFQNFKKSTYSKV